MSWKCSRCQLVNAGLNTTCADYKCREPRPSIVADDELTRLVREKNMSETNAELHAKFFNHEAILVKDMDINQLRKHRDELAMIAFEARARLTAIDGEERVRNAKLSVEQRSWLVSSDIPDPNVTDAIEAVKKRKERMSKADKLKETMLSIGMDIDDVNELMARVKVDEGGKTYGRPLVDKYQFKSSVEESETSDSVEVSKVKPEGEAFNPDELFSKS